MYTDFERLVKADRESEEPDLCAESKIGEPAKLWSCLKSIIPTPLKKWCRKRLVHLNKNDLCAVPLFLLQLDFPDYIFNDVARVYHGILRILRLDIAKISFDVHSPYTRGPGGHVLSWDPGCLAKEEHLLKVSLYLIVNVCMVS